MTDNLSGTANGFVINLPSLPIDGGSSGSGLAINFDMGLSPAGIAQQAYDFLNNSFTQDKGFVNQSISGTQGFLSHQIAPILSGAANQIQQNAKYIPDLYKGLTTTGQSAISAIQSNTAQGIAAAQAETTASINASANAGGGGCFITTAVCVSLGLGDDNVILNKLRYFRDSYMGGKSALKTYYKIAPMIVCAIDARKDSRECYRQLLRRYIIPACRMIDAGMNESARRFYTAGVARARKMAEEYT